MDMEGGNFQISKIGTTFLCVRLLSVLLIQTWFVPDEFYQATEVAHNWVFGYGYITWEWKEGIRSIFYPGIFALIFKLLQIFHLDFPVLLIHAPRVVSALWFAIGDYYTCKVANKVFGHNTTAWTVICLASCWFLSYCAPRTLSSSAEMVFVALTLNGYPWSKEKENSSVMYLLWCGIGCVIRPTVALPILPLFLYHLFQCRRKFVLFFKAVLIVSFILGISIGIDSWYYDKLTIVPLNFLRINTFAGISEHYGTHPWHWYFTIGLPSTMGSHLIPLIIAIIKKPKKYYYFLIPSFFSIFVHSCLNHKEFRFILPILPLLLIISADYISDHLKNCAKKTDIPPSMRTIIILIMLIVPSVFALIFLGVIHQRGPLDLITSLVPLLANVSIPSVFFLTPCHSTPLYSHLHVNISTRFLTCEPNLWRISNYKDESDEFYIDPYRWLHSNFVNKDAFHLVRGPHKMGQYYIENMPKNWPDSSQDIKSSLSRYEALRKPYPSHIVIFDTLESEIKQFLDVTYYRLCKRIFNSYFSDGKKGKYFHIYCKI